MHSDTRDPPEPSQQGLAEHMQVWNTDPEYTHYLAQEEVLRRMFSVTAPGNTDLTDVFTKVSLLNDMYNTNIFRTYDVALHITGMGIDSRLGSGDIGLVDDMKDMDLNGRTVRLYSFSAKYCSHHNRSAFPIYDSYIDTLLCHFRKKDGFSEFRKPDLKDYRTYRGILDDFISFYGLVPDYTDVTRYLWMLGREYFNRFA